MDPHSLEETARAATAGDERAYAKLLSSMRHFFEAAPSLGPYLGAEIVRVERDRVTMRLPWRPELQRGGGIFHGGAIMALADHAAGLLFNTDPRNTAAGMTGLTTDFTASFMRAAPPGEAIVADATVVRRGRRVTFMAISVRGEKSGEEIAAARTTYVSVPAVEVGRKV
jgi:uncharacterized protein (TIGR00369 family)